MRPRLYDYRVRFNTVDAPGEVSPNGDTTTVQYIIRRRLEKKDPTAAVSDVVQPIIYRLNESVPDEWAPAMRRAIEGWIPVFESIGFRNAIVVRMRTDPPPADDEIENQIGFFDDDGAGGTTNPDDLDPRTGELVQTTISLSTGMAPFGQRAYFAVAGMTDRRARYPYPDSLTAAIVAVPMIHELGHTFGLDHHFKGAAVYPPDSLRQPAFARRMGPMATIMSYTPFNYVSQPEDGVLPEDFLPRIGPYDRWALSWGYRPIPEATTPEAERPMLEQWRAVQDTTYYLQPSLDGGEGDPYDQPDAFSNDMLKAAQYAVRNLGRLAATLTREPMNEMEVGRYGLLDRWGVILQKLAGVIGAQVPQMPYPARRQDIRWQPIDPAYQMQTIRFVLNQLAYGDSAGELAKQVVGDSTSFASSHLILFDSVAPGWDMEMAQRVQGTLVGTVLQPDNLKKMAGQMSAAQRQEMIPAFCRELTALEQLISQVIQSSSGARRKAAEGLRGLVTPALDPKNDSCH